MTKPIFENRKCGRRWAEGKETEDGEMSCGIVSAGVKELPLPQSNGSRKGEAKPHLVIFALAKTLSCLKKKLIQI